MRARRIIIGIHVDADAPVAESAFDEHAADPVHRVFVVRLHIVVGIADHVFV